MHPDKDGRVQMWALSLLLNCFFVKRSSQHTDYKLYIVIQVSSIEIKYKQGSWEPNKIYEQINSKLFLDTEQVHHKTNSDLTPLIRSSYDEAKCWTNYWLQQIMISAPNTIIVPSHPFNKFCLNLLDWTLSWRCGNVAIVACLLIAPLIYLEKFCHARVGINL